MPAEDTRELLRRYARDGDEQAFRLLVERHAGLVYSAAQRKLGVFAAHAGDIAQAVFIRLAQRAKVLPDEVVLAAWLHSMAVRYALNHLRSERRRATREQIAHAMNDDRRTVAAWPQIALEIDDSLAALSTRDREVLLLRYVEDLDLATTGHALGISPDAAQKRIARALERLRGQLRRRGVVALPAAVSACLASPMLRAVPEGFATAAAKVALGSGRYFAASTMAAILESWKAFPGHVLAGASIAALLSLAVTRISSPERSSAPHESMTFVPVGGASQEGANSLTGEARELMQLLQAQLSPEEIVAELGRICMAPRTAMNRARMSALLGLIGAENAPAVADLAERTLPLSAAYRTIKPILERWCRFDGAATLEFVLTRNLETKFDDQSFPGIAGTLFGQWRKADRAAAATWLAQNVENPQLRNAWELTRPLLNELAWSSPREAVAFVGSLPRASLRKSRASLLANICDIPFAAKRTNQQWMTLASAVGSHEQSHVRNQLSVVVSGWAAFDDAAVHDWIDQLPAGPQKLEAAVALVAVENTWCNTSRGTSDWSYASVPVTDRAERADAALAAAGLEPRGSAFAQIAAAWPRPDDSVINWFHAQSQGGGDTDGAWQVLASKMAAEDFGPSVQANAIQVAGRITEPVLREKVMVGLFLRWHLRDATAAEAWMNTAGPPKDLLATLADAIRP